MGKPNIERCACQRRNMWHANLLRSIRVAHPRVCTRSRPQSLRVEVGSKVGRRQRTGCRESENMVACIYAYVVCVQACDLVPNAVRESDGRWRQGVLSHSSGVPLGWHDTNTQTTVAPGPGNTFATDKTRSIVALINTARYYTHSLTHSLTTIVTSDLA